jgi:Flp pilus assembly protein TadD
MPYLGGATLNALRARVCNNGVPRKAQVILDAARTNTAAEPPPWTTAAAHSEAVLRRSTYAVGVRHLARQMLEALAFIHAHGVVHRDLKPSNVLLANGAVPMLLDFNLSDDVRVADARFGGTPIYMSPEQLELMGKPGADDAFLDARSDLFSLGVILYELLAGEHPFAPMGQETSLPQTRRELLWNHEAGARPVRELNPSVDRAMADLIGRCLAYAPEARPESAKSALALLPTIAAPRTARRTQTGVLLLLTLALAGGYFSIAGPPDADVSVRPAPVAATAVSDLQLGHEAHARQDYELAVTHFGRHLANHTKDGDAWFARGLAFLRLAEQGRQSFGLAVSDLGQADQLRPDVQTKACLGYALQREDDRKSASLYYVEAIKRGCDSAAVFNNLGYIYLTSSQWSEAERCFDRAVKLQPGLQEAYHNRGRMYLMLAKPRPRMVATATTRKPAARSEENLLEQALRDVSRAIELGPPSCHLYLDAAAACARLTAYDPELRDRAIGWLDLGLQYGLDPKQLERNYFTGILAGHCWFEELRQRPRVVHAATEPRRLVAISAD